MNKELNADTPLTDLKRKAHKNALAVMTEEFFWNELDDMSPFGSDTGNDVLRLYITNRLEAVPQDATSFFDDLWNSWGYGQLIDNNVGAGNNILDSERLKMSTALVFAQLIFDGAVDPRIKSIAIQLLESAISSEVRNGETKDRLTKICSALKSA
jgi:uncharacterized protein YfeS